MDNRQHQQVIGGKYQLGHTLGKGMSGKVKQGRDIQDGSFVAVKLIFMEGMSVRAAQHLQREIKAMKTLQHPNIMQLRDVYNDVYTKKNGEKKQVVALVLELADAGELFEFVMHTGRFQEAVARTLFSQLCSAMVHCHAANVAHRDLKPENVLLDGKFQLKVADFGLASINDENPGGMCKTRCGTISYMAPEVFAGSRSYDPTKADVWSAGVVLFIMIAGNPPFEQAASTDWWYTACRCQRYDRFWAAHLRTCPDFPTLAQDLLNRIFVEDPAKRPSFDQIRQHAWLKDGQMLEPLRLQAELQERLTRVEAVKAAQRQRELERMGAGGTSGESQASSVDPFSCSVVRSAGTAGLPPMIMLTPKAILGALYSTAPLDQLLEALARALASCTETSAATLTLEGEPAEPQEDEPRVTIKKESGKVKAFYPQRDVQVVAQVHSMGEPAEDASGLLLVTITRLQGDAWQFDAIRRSVVAALEKEGAICSEPECASAPESRDIFDDMVEGIMPAAPSVGSTDGEDIELI